MVHFDVPTSGEASIAIHKPTHAATKHCTSVCSTEHAGAVYEQEMSNVAAQLLQWRCKHREVLSECKSEPAMQLALLQA